ncbi:MAG: hypothetical protein PHY02_07640 [Phycisphaerae bacterium]|nr:hypothetical protein [Phycisphaerae bacterium]
MVSEGDEENVGAYLLVNCDDDNGDDTPDLYESGTGPDDDLAKIELSAEQLNEGTLELIKTGSIKLWQDQNKSAEQTTLTWDLATTTPPSTLWVEGVGRSSAERDMGLELRHINGSVTTSDKVKMTVVMLNLGNAVYRDINKTGVPQKERGHAALIYKYLGSCTRDDLDNADNFKIIEMSGPTDDHSLTTMTNYPGYPCYGCYTNISDITYAKRLAIIKTAKQLVARAPLDYEWNDALLPVNWNGNLSNISSLRCDGLVEVCYELNGINVWAMERSYEGTSYNYDISDQTDILSYNGFSGTWSAGSNDAKDNLEEHDDFDGTVGDWYDTLMPATQCGKVTPVEAMTRFSKQDLCQPIGNKGGN